MKQSIFLFIGVCLVLLVFACGKENIPKDSTATNTTTTGTTTTTANSYLYVIADKSQITANGTDAVKFVIRDGSYIDVTSSSIIYVNDKALTTNTFTTTVAGTYQVKAVNGNLTSAPVSLTVVTQASTTTGGNAVTVSGTYTQKVLAEFFTGTWCGTCPGDLIPVETYTEANPNTIVVYMHGPAGSPDPFQYTYDAQLRAAFGIVDQPNVLLNRTNFWDGQESTFNTLSKNTAVLGIGLATSISGATISVNVKVKFGLNIYQPLKLVVYLIEDGLLYDQVNYGYYNLPNPIPNFIHHNVMRNAATDIFGDDIPSIQQTTNNIWQKSYTVDASKYKVANCKIVAFVLYGDNASGLKGVLNTQIVNAGQSISY